MAKAIDVLSTSVAQSLRLLVHSFLENSGFKLHATKQRSSFALPNQTTRTRGVVDTRWGMNAYPNGVANPNNVAASTFNPPLAPLAAQTVWFPPNR
jgi:hypothetical protein